MARIFTTRFRFNHQDYDAIVTVLNHDGKLDFHIKLLDADLYDLLPDGQVRYEGREGFRRQDWGSHMAENLVQSIAGSIDDHLSGT